ncbi:MAG: hypothetical protein ACRDUY_01300 [Nitriliruptorales bacterium]
MSQDPPPDPTAWSTIEDPRERVATALKELYSHYARNEQMLENVFRDMYLVDSMRAFNVPLVEGSFEHMTEVLSSAFDDESGLAGRRKAIVAVAVSFDTWKVLVSERGLGDEDAAELMTGAVAAGVD